MPQALARLERSHPGVEVDLSEAEPPKRSKRYAPGPPTWPDLGYEHEDAAPRLACLAGVVEVRLVLLDPAPGLGTIRELGDRAAVWAAGCPRCRAHLLRIARTGWVHPAHPAHH